LTLCGKASQRVGRNNRRALRRKQDMAKLLPCLTAVEPGFEVERISFELRHTAQCPAVIAHYTGCMIKKYGEWPVEK